MMAMQGFLRAVTDFIFVRDEPAPADLLLIPGSSHSGHVMLAAELYRRGFAPLLLPSGFHAAGEAHFSLPGYESEWAWMRDVLLREGVPPEAILREDQALCTWHNAVYSARVIAAQGLRIRRAILCCKPYHARRALFYYQAALPDTELRVCVSDEPGFNADDWYRTPEGRSRVLGEVTRLGRQIPDVLEEALAAEEGHPHDNP